MNTLLAPVDLMIGSRARPTERVNWFLGRDEPMEQRMRTEAHECVLCGHGREHPAVRRVSSAVREHYFPQFDGVEHLFICAECDEQFERIPSLPPVQEWNGREVRVPDGRPFARNYSKYIGNVGCGG